MRRKRFKGTVKNSVIVLEKGAHFPDGTEVEIRLPMKRTEKERQEAFERFSKKLGRQS
jgi:hypothetical protein